MLTLNTLEQHWCPFRPESSLGTKILLLCFIMVVTLFTTSVQECGTGRFNRHRDPRDQLFLNQDISDNLEGSGDELSFDGGVDIGVGGGIDGAARLVGGTASVPGEWPWQATLQLRHPRWGFVGHWCAGVLIHPRWVITAGHCITNRLFNLPRANYWTVVLGKYNLRMKEPNEIVRRVSRIVLHEKFQEYHNDLALIKLAQPVPRTGPLEFVNPICLPNTNLTRNETFTGLRCVATGWGRAKVGGRNSDYLQKVELPVVANDVCKGAYQKEPIIPIRNYHVCAGYAAGGKGTCIGDSGGPLQCPIGDGRWFLVGLTSFGSGCAKPSFPDVFTRVTYYLDWIQKHMKTK